MIRRSIAILLVTIPLCLSAEGFSKAKAFGIFGFVSGLVAIGADVLADHYYDRYEAATLPDDCIHFRNRTKLCEKTRDAAFGVAVASFSVSTIFWLSEKKPEVGMKLDYKKERLCVGLVSALE